MSKTQKRRPPKQSTSQPAQPKPPKLDASAQINHHAAGLDIGDAEIYAAVPESAAGPRCVSSAPSPPTWRPWPTG